MEKICFNCKTSENESPLFELHFQKEYKYICPRCVPQLIHKPTNFIGTLLGAEDMMAANDV